MKIILVGCGGSGKDFLKSKMIKKGFKPEISYTTRPQREGEEEGIDYFFVTEEQLDTMIKFNQIKSVLKYGNGFRYATSKQSFEESELFIKTPSGIAELTPEERKDFFVIFLDIPTDMRRERLLRRSDAHDAERRLLADAIDFENFKDYDLRITNPDF